PGACASPGSLYSTGTMTVTFTRQGYTAHPGARGCDSRLWRGGLLPYALEPQNRCERKDGTSEVILRRGSHTAARDCRTRVKQTAPRCGRLGWCRPHGTG